MNKQKFVSQVTAYQGKTTFSCQGTMSASDLGIELTFFFLWRGR